MPAVQRDVPPRQMPVRLRRHYLPCQSGGLLPVDVYLRRMPFDPHKVKTPCGFESQLSVKLVPLIRVPFIALLGLTTCTIGRNSHDVFTV